ncbi:MULTISPECIES: hypothetical protein [Bacteroidales]|uniref:DUF3408 domain-containing protein n=1 Tax=Heminiphilus faecis TaxID=2601703 RepID=A0ABV4CYG2_9BACT|nr:MULTISPECIES: hypothetical protein [Bacteroidales]
MARTITPKIDARLFTAQMNAKEKARCNIRQYIPIGAVKGNFWDDAPAPGMYYDTDINMWCPESFKLEKMEIIEEDTQRIIDTTPDEEREGYSVNGKKLVPYVSVVTERMNARKNIDENPAREVQQVHCDTGTPIASNHVSIKEEKATAIPKSARTTSRSRIVDIAPPVEPISITEPIVPIEVSKPTVEPQPEAVEQSKKTRRSARMDEADFDILASQFIYPTDLAEKKPLFFPTDIRESLKLVARLIPGGKVSPSHIAIHIIRAWLDENRDLLNRMLSSQKLSI